MRLNHLHANNYSYIEEYLFKYLVGHIEDYLLSKLIFVYTYIYPILVFESSLSRILH